MTDTATLTGKQPTRRKGFSLKRQENITGWCFILPTLIGFSVFTFGSIVYSFYISMTKWDLLTPARFIGFKNYIKIFSDPEFYTCLSNTAYFVVTLVPSVLVLSMILAILINKGAKGFSNFYRSAMFIPSITSTVAISMIWLWILNPDVGIINEILRGIGVMDPPRWLQSTLWAKPALVIMRIWQMCGYYMIMFLAGLQTIPESLYEAAEVDGATKLQKTMKITVPMLSNTTFVVAVMLIIESFNIFVSIFVMTECGPNGSTNTLMYYIYNEGFRMYNMGYASALAWILFIMILIITLIQFKFKKDNNA
ncbi:MAG: sugar ABC transporter permease [Angelakisella sp.]